jgi:carbon monoxide dehydrogenase subunit G
MKIQGSYTFDAPRERVWRALLDPEILARTLPGCEKLERVGENDFRGALNVQVGPVKGQFQGSLQLSDLHPLEGYHMKLDGKGPAGFMSGEGDLRLADEGGKTALAYDLDAQIGGRVAGVGQRLIESSAKSITRQGLEGLARELAAMGPSPAEAGAVGAAAEETLAPSAPTTPFVPPAPAVQPTQAEVAARVASDVARDLVPPERRPWLLGVGLLALAAVVFVLMRACGG